MLYMIAQTVLVVPKMFDATPEHLQWLVFFISAGLLFTGCAAIDNKDDLKYHYTGAVVSCLASAAWLVVVQPFLLFVPLIAMCSGGWERIQWCGEIGLIVAVYIQLII